MGVHSQASPVLDEPLEKDHVWSIITAGQKTSSTSLSMGKTDAPPLDGCSEALRKKRRGGTKKKKVPSPWGEKQLGKKGRMDHVCIDSPSTGGRQGGRQVLQGDRQVDAEVK